MQSPNFYKRLTGALADKLNSYFINASIRSKLITIVMGVTLGVLCMAFLSQTILHYVHERESLMRQQERAAQIIGKNIEAATLSARPDLILSMFHTIADKSDINLLCLYDASGKLLNAYPESDPLCDGGMNNEKLRNSFSNLRVLSKIEENSQTTGYLLIQYNLTATHIAFLQQEAVALIPILISIVIAYVMINALHSVIIGPIENLANSLEAITKYQTYDIQLKSKSKDEIGQLISAFNNLIHFIRENEKEILKAKEEVELASRSKDQFLANMSHELRTPLNSIIGFVRILMQEPDLPREHKATLSIVDKSSTALLEIVNDILDISKIEAGKIVLMHKPFNLAAVLYSALDQISPLASQKGLEIRSNESDLPLVNVVGDQIRLGRIVLNLLSNAVKYTQEGHVDIQVSLKFSSKERVTFECVVEDTGIGIPENKLDMIFDKFTQAEETAERSFGGTGLGLNITKQLVTLMGGRIGVKSKVGEGSRFMIQIPFAVAPYDDKAPIVTEEAMTMGSYDHIVRKDISKAKVLVAEDQEFNQYFIVKLLKRAGVEHIILTNHGEEVYTAFKKENPDIILMDCHMPIMNGYEATKMIRAYEREKDVKNPVPILAMTADAMAGAREACVQAGMDEYIGKPIDEDVFRSFLENWFVMDTALRPVAVQHSVDEDVIILDKPADLTILQEYADGDEDVQRELIDVFYTKTLKDLELLELNITEGENRDWSEAAHALKGSAAYIGALRLRDLCDQGQSLMVASRTERETLFQQISSEHTTICSFLKDQNLL